MHFHAIKRSTNLSGVANSRRGCIGFQVDGNASTTKDEPSIPRLGTDISNGDDACDLRPWPKDVPFSSIPELRAAWERLSVHSRDAIRTSTPEILHEVSPAEVNALQLLEKSQASSSSHGSRLAEESIKSLNFDYQLSQPFNEFITPKSTATIEDDRLSTSTHSTSPFLNVVIPTEPTNNLAPFAYQRVLRNRIKDKDLSPGKKYDIEAYTPMFVHDCLMMPDSLANIRGKVRIHNSLARCLRADLRSSTGLHGRHNPSHGACTPALVS